MNILILADPVEKLKPMGDSSLLMVRQALKRAHRVFWATQDELSYDNSDVIVSASEVSKCGEAKLPELGSEKVHSLTDFDVVLVRKDPPFHLDYLKLCWMLGLAEKKTKIINSPSVLLRHHEKLIAFEAVTQEFLSKKDVVPTHIGRVGLDKFISQSSEPKFVIKPFFGFAGLGVELVDKNKIFELMKQTKYKDALVQPFLPEIFERGDRRVLYVDGKYLGHFARFPSEGKFVANLAQGGKAVTTELNESEKAVVAKVGQFLKANNIVLAGLDLIGSSVSEINITSPTGLVNLIELGGRDCSEDLLDYVEV